MDMNEPQSYETFVSILGSVESYANILTAPIEDAVDDDGMSLRYTDVTCDDETHIRIFSYLNTPEYSHILSTDPDDSRSLYSLLSQLGVKEEFIAVASDEDGPLRDLEEIRRAVTELRLKTRH